MSNDQVKVEPLVHDTKDEQNPVTWQEKAANRKNEWFEIVDHSLSAKVIKS